MTLLQIEKPILGILIGNEWNRDGLDKSLKKEDNKESRESLLRPIFL